MVAAREDGKVDLVHVVVLAGSSLGLPQDTLIVGVAHGELVVVLRERLKPICLDLNHC